MSYEIPINDQMNYIFQKGKELHFDIRQSCHHPQKNIDELTALNTRVNISVIKGVESSKFGISASGGGHLNL